MDSLTGRLGLSRNVLGVAVGLLVLSGGWASGLERSNRVVADAHYSGGEIYFQARVRASAWTLTVAGPGDFALQTRSQGSPPSVSLYDEDGQPLPDGSYTYELQAEITRSTSTLQTQGEEGPDGRRVTLREGATPYSVPALSGHFRISGGSIVAPGRNEPSAPAAAQPVRGTRAAPDQPFVAAPDQQILDDLIVVGSICVGQDCSNGESFGFDTLRLKENNLRIKAQDTSTSASFPTNDWQITFNDSSNGGQNKFSIDDIDGGRTPFTIEASAPSHSLYVDDGGRVGFGTSTPVTQLHVKDGNTPTLRLEQDGSSGFTAQTWDLAGNEANFFIRDATHGSTLPLRIFPDAPSNALTIEGSTGDVGVGTTTPDADLDISRSGGRVNIAMEDTTSGNSWQIVMDDDGDANAGLSFTRAGTGQREFRIAPTGEVFINATSVHTPDYVFEPDYGMMPLDELAAFVTTEKHLPNIPPADEIRQNGLPMISFQMRLLEKIEELTLYTIAQQEEIAALREQVEALSNRTAR